MPENLAAEYSVPENIATENMLLNNFFELFDIPVAFDIDQKKIKQQYMELQSRVHPDKFASADDAEKRLSMQQTSFINEAMQTLKDPVLRASYLLKLKGMDINLENETTMDAAFLMQQLEMREVLEKVKARSTSMAGNNEGDLTESLDQLDDMRSDVNRKIATTMTSFSDAYEKDALDDAREWIRKLQFLQKAKYEVSALSADIEDELMKLS